MHSAVHHASTSFRLSSLEIIKRRRNCSRLLFGAPDPKELDDWLKSREAAHAAAARDRWDFDFERGVPVESSSGGGAGDYQYETLPETDVPEFYRAKNIKGPQRSRVNTPRKRKHAAMRNDDSGDEEANTEEGATVVQIRKKSDLERVAPPPLLRSPYLLRAPASRSTHHMSPKKLKKMETVAHKTPDPKKNAQESRSKRST